MQIEHVVAALVLKFIPFVKKKKPTNFSKQDFTLQNSYKLILLRKIVKKIMHKQMFRINKFELARYLPNISTLKNELETPLQ